jgi:peptidoglycan hydrolase-like protein with peptidoglycan-binding domain
LQERIQALLQQIAGLQQQLAALLSNHGNATSSPAVIPPGQVGKAACISLNRDLHEGDSGDDVMSIQQMLAADPSTGFNVAPTGYFGSMTAQAMIRFQEKNGIASSTQSTGIVGPLTRGFFERHCGEGLMHQEQEGQNWASTTASTTPEWHVNMPMLPYMPGNSGESHGQNSDHGNNQGGNSQDN